MGTSNIFNGKNDKNPLLPDDYDPNQAENSDEQEPVKWKTVKSDMSKYINSGGQYGSSRHIAQQYVKAAGGSNRMASQSYAGINTGGNIGRFFNSIISDGVETTFKNLGIEYVGKSVSAVFSRLVDVIAHESDTKEEIAAKEATISALARVLEYVEDNSMDIECMDNMPQELMDEALKEYVGSYIWAVMMSDLGSRLEMYISNSQNAYDMESEFKGMIMGIVDVEFNNKGIVINQNIKIAMKDLYEQCLCVLEGIV